MADKGTASLAASVFMDDIKSSMGGSLSYEPKDANDKWIFAEIAVGANADLIAALDFLGATGTIATSDAVHWIAVKNVSTTITDGIVLSTEGGTTAWNLAGGIAIGSGEMVILKLCAPATTINHIHGVSVTMDATGNYPTGTHSGTVNCQVAAILDDL
tara:strand:+ start:262 stop:735 length:474 start_codon:yes stop_codon:yes gene_type:complete